jgi:hypothetical protein
VDQRAGAAARERLTALLLSVLIVSGCTSMRPAPPQPTVTPAWPEHEPIVPPAPAPPRPTVTLAATKATTYYSVHGTTTSTIFEEIRAQGLVEQDGMQAVGLAAANSELKWKVLWGSERAFTGLTEALNWIY